VSLRLICSLAGREQCESLSSGGGPRVQASCVVSDLNGAGGPARRSPLAKHTRQDLAMRARIVLACANPHVTNTAIAH
jgi:hypothetical protein